MQCSLGTGGGRGSDMEAAGYTLNLYCDSPNHKENFPKKFTSLDAEYYGQTYAECKRMAKRDGWKWRKDLNICKKCS